MPQYNSPFSNITPVVKNLLIINILFWVSTLVLGYTHIFDMNKWLSAYYFHSPASHPWQIITYMFMHAGIDHPEHIFFNMFALFSFGPILEYSMGSKRFLNYYFVCGIGAVVLHMAVQAFEIHAITGTFKVNNPGNDSSFLAYGQILGQKLYDIYYTPIVGASGAIFGLLIAFGLLFPNMDLMIMFIPIPIKAKYLVTVYIAIELFLGVKQYAGDSVAHFAHLGGALIGFIMIKIWGMRRQDNV